MAIFPNVTGQPIGPHQPAQPINIQAWTEQATQSLNAVSLSSPGGVRGTSVSLAIPLDEQAAAKRSAGAAEGQHGPDTSEAVRPHREPLRRDSLKRREALLKGKEGSRRRQRWENDRLLNNPWAQPPLPSDWEVHPTYPKHSVPYYLAPLWDAHVAAKKGADVHNRATQKKHERPAAGDSKVPKELREKLKKTKAAKGLLQDLEEQVRNFIKQWEDKNKKPASASKPELDSDDEEIVFIGRNGQMHDVPQSPHAARDDFDEDDIRRDKLVFDSSADDHGASFGRWLVHSIATYYDLHTWSVTVGHPARREAYVGLKSGRPVSPTGTLPRPLWGMV
ncbi:MAG: hypothetical protein L6R37_004926 [Teloschistes peruensis]|nr:MAG: hypothetical protein L6R37_004926 [Teloschistes peruensis]